MPYGHTKTPFEVPMYTTVCNNHFPNTLIGLHKVQEQNVKAQPQPSSKKPFIIWHRDIMNAFKNHDSDTSTLGEKEQSGELVISCI